MSEARFRYTLSLCIFKIVLEVLASATKQQKDTKGTKLEKKKKKYKYHFMPMIWLGMKSLHRIYKHL